MKKIFASVFIAFALRLNAKADLLDSLGIRKSGTNQVPGISGAAAALSQDQVVSGLKEALGKGVQQAIAHLGHEGGFLTNMDVKILMPQKLRTVEKSLRTLKQDKLADEFVVTMNHAAEQAIPEAAPVFSDAIKTMSIADARTILSGTNNAATEYFRHSTSSNLFARFLPVVKKATDSTGVTSTYKSMREKVTGANSFGGFGKSLLGDDSFDVDSYVTSQALNGLFKMVADEEKRIRANPAARTSDLLKKVFGSVAK